MTSGLAPTQGACPASRTASTLKLGKYCLCIHPLSILSNNRPAEEPAVTEGRRQVTLNRLPGHYWTTQNQSRVTRHFTPSPGDHMELPLRLTVPLVNQMPQKVAASIYVCISVLVLTATFTTSRVTAVTPAAAAPVIGSLCPLVASALSCWSWLLLVTKCPGVSRFGSGSAVASCWEAGPEHPGGGAALLCHSVLSQNIKKILRLDSSLQLPDSLS